MIDGLPSADCEARRWGYKTYDRPIAPPADQSIPVEISDICNKVRSLGFKRLAVLDSVNANDVSVEWKNCTET